MAEQNQTKEQQKENFRYFVRIANTDLDGNKPIGNALRKIKGVSFMFSNMICSVAGIDKGGYPIPRTYNAGISIKF